MELSAERSCYSDLYIHQTVGISENITSDIWLVIYYYNLYQKSIKDRLLSWTSTDASALLIGHVSQKNEKKTLKNHNSIKTVSYESPPYD